METFVFRPLVKLLREKQLLSDGLLKVEEQVAMFLCTLAKNVSNRSVQEQFQHSGDTVSRHFYSVLNAINQLSSELIIPPPLRTPQFILSRGEFYPFFKDCIGAIDRTQIPISIDENRQDPYRNRKQTLSQNVMVVCDFDRRFTHVMAGWEGSASDATVLKSALDDEFTVPQGKYYLVDAGYANTPKFLAPYRGIHYHLREQGLANERPQNYKELFNLRHAKLRNHIKRIIGIIKMRFSILKVATYHTIDTQSDLVDASCTLHNFIVNHNGDTNWTTNVAYDTVEQNEIVDVPDGDEEYGEDVEALNNLRRAGHKIREAIAMNLWNDYVRHRRSRNSN